MTQRFTETNSEKRRRGRPQKFTAAQLEVVAQMFPEVRTLRGRQNVSYRLRAISVLENQPDCRWVIDPVRARAGAVGSWRPAILTELGRLANDDHMVKLARQICRLKPKTSEAVAMIRRARIGRQRPASADDLADRLIATLNTYLASHEGCDVDVALAAVDTVRMAVAGHFRPGVATC